MSHNNSNISNSSSHPNNTSTTAIPTNYNDTLLPSNGLTSSHATTNTNDVNIAKNSPNNVNDHNSTSTTSTSIWKPANILTFAVSRSTKLIGWDDDALRDLIDSKKNAPRNTNAATASNSSVSKEQIEELGFGLIGMVAETLTNYLLSNNNDTKSPPNTNTNTKIDNVTNIKNQQSNSTTTSISTKSGEEQTSINNIQKGNLPDNDSKIEQSFPFSYTDNRHPNQNDIQSKAVLHATSDTTFTTTSNNNNNNTEKAAAAIDGGKYILSSITHQDNYNFRDLKLYQVLLSSLKNQRDHYIMGPSFAKLRKFQRDYDLDYIQPPSFPSTYTSASTASNRNGNNRQHDYREYLQQSNFKIDFSSSPATASVIPSSLGYTQLNTIATWFIPSSTMHQTILPTVLWTIAKPNLPPYNLRDGGPIYKPVVRALTDLIPMSQSLLDDAVKNSVLYVLNDDSIKGWVKGVTNTYVSKLQRDDDGDGADDDESFSNSSSQGVKGGRFVTTKES